MGKINEQQTELDFTDGDDELKQKVLSYDGKVPYMNSLKQRLQSGEELIDKDRVKVEKYFNNPDLYEKSVNNPNIPNNIKNFDKVITSIYNKPSEHFGDYGFGKWLYMSNGLNLMSVIESKLSLNVEKYTPIKDQDLLSNTFRGVEILNNHPTYGRFVEKVGENSYLITPISGSRNKIKITKSSDGIYTTDFKFYHDENDKWHQVNKLNTNGGDLILLIKTLVINHKELFVGINYLVNTKETLKQFLMEKRDEIVNFINEMSENTFISHTETSTKTTQEGEIVEDLVVDKIKRSWGVTDNDIWSGGNGDIIDMLLGVDIIFKDGNDWKTVQVKKDIQKWEKGRPVKGKVDTNKLFGGRYRYVDLGAGGITTIRNRETGKWEVSEVVIVDSGGNILKETINIDNLIENFIETGKVVTEQNIYQTYIGVGTEKVSYEQIYQMFFPFNRMTKNYPELREYREIIKNKCLKSADGDLDKAKDYCDEVFLNDISLFFRKGYHFPNMDKLIRGVIKKVGTGLIDLHRKRTAQKRNPNYTKRMDDKYFDRVSSTEEGDKEYTDELVRQAVDLISNKKYQFAVKSKYFYNMSQDEMAEVWEEETGQEDSSSNWGVYTQRGRAEFKKNLLKLKEDSDDFISEYVEKFLDL